VPEGNINAEIASHLREHEPSGASHMRLEIIEILEAILLAVVAVSTALSGYQAAKWDGVSGRDYATASRERVQAEQASLTSNQLIIYNSDTLNTWMQAVTAGNTRLSGILVRRFTPNYRVAFDAWLKTDPLTNPKAPAGPRFMPQYKDPLAAQSLALSNASTHSYDHGVDSRETADKYVRLTVILAAVLFLVAIGQRFRIRRVRQAVLCVAGGLIVYCAVLLIIYPRA
jgi:hypothetical protein